MTNAAHRTYWFEVIEKARQRAKKRASKERVLLLAPRKHGKTEAVTSYIAREVCLNRNIKILWICATSTDAEKRFGKVKQLLHSAKIQEDWTTAPEEGFGPFHDPDKKKDKWTAKELVVVRSGISVHATIYAIGAGTAPTGGHYDLIIADDLENESSCNTAALRAKTRSWFFSELWPTLNPGGTMIVIGTKKHSDDLYTHLENNPFWITVKQQAIEEWPDRFQPITEYDPLTKADRVIGMQVEGDSKVLWPDIAKVLGGGKADAPTSGIEYLLAERAGMGSLMFAREFQHQVQDDESAPFPMEYLDRAKEMGRHLKLGDVPPEVTHIVQGWDISLVDDPEKAREKDRDFTVGITWGLDDNGNRYLLDIARKRGMSIDIFKAMVQTAFLKFGGLAKVKKIAVEKNNFGTLHYAGLKRTTDLPIVPHETGKNKADPWEGVPSLLNLFETGKIILPYSDDCPVTRELVDVVVTELWGLGTEKHDDTVMAMWIAETVLRQTRFDYSFAAGELTEEEEKKLDDEMTGDPFWDSYFDNVKADGETPLKTDNDLAAKHLWDSLSDMVDF